MTSRHGASARLSTVPLESARPERVSYDASARRGPERERGRQVRAQVAEIRTRAAAAAREQFRRDMREMFGGFAHIKGALGQPAVACKECGDQQAYGWGAPADEPAFWMVTHRCETRTDTTDRKVA